MNILITGGTGLIGRALIRALQEKEHKLSIVSRHVDRAKQLLGPEVTYYGSTEEVSNFESLDAVINLAGEPIADKAWTDEQKRKIIESRVRTTRQCVRMIERLETRPRIFLSASAIGYYGHGEEECTEKTPAGEGFLPDIGKRWESEALKAEAAGVRVCLMRLGIVLAADGGAYRKMLPPFQMKVAGQLGSGQQWMSWIHRQDVIGATLFLLENETCRGPYNFTAPDPVTNAEFTRILGKIKQTWISMKVPGWVMRRVLGELADELLLQGQKVLPAALRDAGYSFQFPKLQQALEDLQKD
jgi:uncharacterized protein (TIGR01777 family)